jgi:hypothetical protein
MTERIPFYEMAKLARKTYAVVAVEVKNDAECKHSIPIFNKAGGKVGALKCDSVEEEIYDCACCGMPSCEEHLSTVAVHGDYVCTICERLPMGIIEEVIKLRTELNK